MYQRFKTGLLLSAVCVLNSLAAQSSSFIYAIDSGMVSFTSDAPLELIQASSDLVRGIIDTQKNTFGFTIPMNSFHGFNSPLQQEHFNEKYLETNRFPKATFSGKIIEEIDFSQPGEYKVRAKGKFLIHGIEQERIIRSTLTVKEEEVAVKADFTVLLAEHNINIPRIVNQKIAEVIQVTVTAVFTTAANEDE